MPKTFRADLEALVGRLEEAIRECEAGHEENTTARASIETALASGVVAVHTLDVIVTNSPARRSRDDGGLAARPTRPLSRSRQAHGGGSSRNDGSRRRTAGSRGDADTGVGDRASCAHIPPRRPRRRRRRRWMSCQSITTFMC